MNKILSVGFSLIAVFILGAPSLAHAEPAPTPGAGTEVIIGFQGDDVTIDQELPKGTNTSPTSACTPASVTKRYPDLAKNQGIIAACANQKEQVSTLLSKRAVAQSAVSILNTRIAAQQATLAEIGKVKKTDGAFPGATVSPAGFDGTQPITTVTGIAAQCVQTNAQGPQEVHYVGVYNPSGDSEAKLDPVSQHYKDLFAEYQRQFAAVQKETNKTKKDKLVSDMLDFVDANKGIMMFNTSDGWAQFGKSEQNMLKPLSVSVTVAPDNGSCKGFLSGIKDSYTANIDGFNYQTCQNFTAVKLYASHVVNSKLKEFVQKKADFEKKAQNYATQANAIIKASKDCFPDQQLVAVNLPSSTAPTQSLFGTMVANIIAAFRDLFSK